MKSVRGPGRLRRLSATIANVHTSRRSRRAAILRPALTCVLVLALYYAVPVELGSSKSLLLLRIGVSIAAGVGITWLIVRQITFHIEDPRAASPATLLTALVGGVALFALADYTIAVSAPGQFVGLRTKTDGLYFALTTLTTVGFGDVHAAGQLARGVLIVQLVFNVVVIATGASVLMRVIGVRARDRTSGTHR
jgi:voltage-gated potassium channel